MADLKDLYEKLEFTNLTSYIQSGNVVFDAKSSKSGKEMAQMISLAVTDKFGFDIPVIVRTFEEWEETIENNPFAKEKGIDINRLHLTFLADTPSPSNLEAIGQIEYPTDRFQIIGKDAFICVADRYSDSKLTNSFFEKKLNVPATTRNWKTVMKLYELSQ
jgi:uncharacterized protein (DUF1697 family)